MDTRAQSSRASLPIDYNKRLMLFSGRANPQLAVEIAGRLGVELGPVTLKTFSNGEAYCRYEESIRERTCSSCSPPAATRRRESPPTTP